MLNAGVGLIFEVALRVVVALRVTRTITWISGFFTIALKDLV
jgi:hypothetical protein